MDYEEALKTIKEELTKSYSHKPHLADLPHDRRSTNPEELQERIDACTEKIEQEEKKLEGYEKFISSCQERIKEHSQKVKESEETIKKETKKKENMLKLTNNSADSIKKDIDRLGKGLYYEGDKKLTRKQLEEKWSTPQENVNNSLESLKILEKGYEKLNKDYERLEDRLEKFNRFQGRSETENLSGCFSDISKDGKEVDEELEKVHMGYHVPSFLGEADKIKYPFSEWNGERWRIYAINESHQKIYNSNKQKESSQNLIDRNNKDIEKTTLKVDEIKSRIRDYKDERERTGAKKKEVS